MLKRDSQRSHITGLFHSGLLEDICQKGSDSLHNLSLSRFEYSVLYNPHRAEALTKQKEHRNYSILPDILCFQFRLHKFNSCTSLVGEQI